MAGLPSSAFSYKRKCIDKHFFLVLLSLQLNMEQTVDAEITAMMPLQRACDAENQARNKLSNGPLRAQSNGNPRVFCDV